MRSIKLTRQEKDIEKALLKDKPMFIYVFIAILGIVSSLTTWRWNEASKLSQENYIRRERQYAKLISYIHGFGEDNHGKEAKDKFIKELDLCWLYCSDDVIKKAGIFLGSVSIGSKATEEQQQKALAELILSIRKDLINNKRVSETKLEWRDFKFLHATP